MSQLVISSWSLVISNKRTTARQEDEHRLPRNSPTSPLYLPYISPISPRARRWTRSSLHLPCISPISPLRLRYISAGKKVGTVSGFFELSERGGGGGGGGGGGAPSAKLVAMQTEIDAKAREIVTLTPTPTLALTLTLTLTLTIKAREIAQLRSQLGLPYIAPISPLYLPYISPISRRGRSPSSDLSSACRAAPRPRLGEMSGRYRGYMGRYGSVTPTLP